VQAKSRSKNCADRGLTRAYVLASPAVYDRLRPDRSSSFRWSIRVSGPRCPAASLKPRPKLPSFTLQGAMSDRGAGAIDQAPTFRTDWTPHGGDTGQGTRNSSTAPLSVTTRAPLAERAGDLHILQSSRNSSALAEATGILYHLGRNSNLSRLVSAKKKRTHKKKRRKFVGSSAVGTFPHTAMVSGGDSKIGSCTSVIRSNGEIFAVAHPHKKTGYKSANSETNVRMLGSKTSYKQFFEDEVALPTVTKNPKGMSYRCAPFRRYACNSGRLPAPCFSPQTRPSLVVLLGILDRPLPRRS